MARTVRARSLPSRRAPQRRGRTWARHAYGQSFNPASDPVAFDLLGTWAGQVGATLPGLTVGPVIAEFNALPAGGAAEMFFGIIVANREAMAADTNAFDPAQAADRTLDWMFWSHYWLNTVANGDRALHREYRTNSRRKIERVGETLFLVMSPQTTTHTNFGSSSTLVLLP